MTLRERIAKAMLNQLQVCLGISPSVFAIICADAALACLREPSIEDVERVAQELRRLAGQTYSAAGSEAFYPEARAAIAALGSTQ